MGDINTSPWKQYIKMNGVSYVWALTLYNEDLRQLESELRESLVMARKELGCEKKILCCSDSETVIIPLPGYD
jgi:hypothetical protein